jgi:uncharacterized protein (DUF2147 family)
MHVHQRIRLSVFISVAAFASGALAAGSPDGVWLNDTGRGAIEIKPCGTGYCGHVVWLRDTSDVKGCGRQIIGDARQVGEGLYDGGWIYSPEKKRRYDVELKPLADGTLRVKGYAGTKMFSRTMIWKPAPVDLTRCGAPAIDAQKQPEPAPAVAAVTPPPPARETAKPQMSTAPAAPQPSATVKTPQAAAPPAATPEASRPESQPTGAKSGEATSEDAKPSDGRPEEGAGTGDTAEGDDTSDTKEAGLDIGALAEKLEEIERETGYGLKKTSDGNCRLKVPFVTLDVPCDR